MPRRKFKPQDITGKNMPQSRIRRVGILTVFSHFVFMLKVLRCCLCVAAIFTDEQA